MPNNIDEGRQRASVGNLEKIDSIEENLKKLGLVVKRNSKRFSELKQDYEGLFNEVLKQSETQDKVLSLLDDFEGKLKEQENTIKQCLYNVGKFRKFEEQRKQSLEILENTIKEKIKELEGLIIENAENEEMRTELENDLLIYKAQLDTLRAENERIAREKEKAEQRAEKAENNNKYLNNVISEIDEEWTADVDRLTKEKKKAEEDLLPFRSGKGGKGLELSPTEIKNIVKGYIDNKSIKEIADGLSIDKGKVKRVLDGDYKGERAKEQVLYVVNGLLKVNQNIVVLDRLKGLKQKYVKSEVN